MAAQHNGCIYPGDTKEQQSVNFVEVLRNYAKTQPDKHVYEYLKDGEEPGQAITYAELDRCARTIAARLQGAGAQSRALLIYPPGIEFIKAFFGCLYAGITGVPVYLPRARAENWTKLKGILNDAEADVILLDASALEAATQWLLNDECCRGVRTVITNETAAEQAQEWVKPRLEPHGLAFLQYTSGSTGDPKGVMVSHANLMHNQALIASRFEHTQQSVIAGWLPQYHDMGLIGNILHPVYLGSRAILMSPIAFLQHPLRWLKAIDKYRASTSGAPNFAYEFCVQRVSDREKKNLDLSCWDLAFNGAEPVNPDTLERFYQAFKQCGFKKEAFYPCYGLAESTLMVCGVNKSVSPNVVELDRKQLENNRVVFSDSRNNSTTRLVSCGKSDLGVEIKIVDPDTRMPCDGGRVGEIWVKSRSAGQGYWRRKRQTEESFCAVLADIRVGEGPYLRTDDLGFLHRGELYISGRIKDLIILRGKNYYPQDIETVAQKTSPALKVGRGACFSVNTEKPDSHKLVLVQEVERSAVRTENFAALERGIKEAVFNVFELQLDVALVKPGRVAVTSSGKVRRSTCRQYYLQGEYLTLGHLPGSAAEKSLPTNGNIRSLPSESESAGMVYLRKLLSSHLEIDNEQFDREAAITTYGLDSLKAAQLQYQIESDLGIQYDMAKLLSGPTLAALAEELDSLADWRGNRPVAPPADVELTAEREELELNGGELSYNQKVFWYLHNLYRDCAPFNIALLLKVGATAGAVLDVQVFRAAFNCLLGRQPVLRTVYREVDGTPVQIVEDVSVFMDALELIDASGWDEQRLAATVREQALKPFDLNSGPVFRAQLFILRNGGSMFNFVVHHIATDAWSMQLCAKQLARYYKTLSAGSSIEVSPDKVQYLDFARRQKLTLEHPDAGRLASFWRAEFEGFEGITELPVDRRRPVAFSFVGNNLDIAVPAACVARIRALLKQQDTTLYTFMLAVYQVLLYRFMGNDDLVIGSPVSERPAVDYAEVVGCYVDVKPIRTKIETGHTFTSYLAYVKRVVLSVLEHKAYPLQLLMREPQLKDKLSAAIPFPNVRFALQKAHLVQNAAPFFLGQRGERIDLHGLSFEPYPLAAECAQAELSLTVVEGDEQMWLRFNYSSQLFDASTISYLAQCYQSIVESVLDNPAVRMVDIPLEHRQPLTTQPLTTKVADAQNVESQCCIHHLIEAQVEMFPNAAALTCGDTTLTYGQLNERANRLAHLLIERGVTAETRVAVYTQRSADMVVAFLAGLKAGACCVLLEAGLSRARCEYILKDAGVSIVITDNRVPTLAYEANVDEVRLHETDLTSGGAIQNPRVTLTAESAAYVIYTSGSTGEPKGVIGVHRGIVNRTRWMIGEYRLSTDDVVLHSTPLNFVRAEREIFFPLAAGAKLVILASDVLNEPAEMLRALTDHRVTFTASSPAHLKILLDTDREKFAALTSLKNWFIGADVLDEKLIRAVQTLQPNMQLSYFYGSTETTSDVSCFRIPWRYAGGEFATPIGKPLSNTGIYILDKSLNPVPEGGVGEVHIAGAQLSRGYAGAARLTAQKFIPDPFSGQAGARLYKMGDLARRLSNGDMIILGRKDTQVNLHGFRIELGEVERALLGCDSVKSAVVTLHAENGDKKYLVAYIVVESGDGAEFNENALREQLRQQLPEYMLPSVYLPLDKLPLTSLGKLNRRQLPSPAAALQARLEVTYQAPANALETLLVNIWENALCVERIGVNDNFFQLGGSSLLSTQVIASIKNEIGVSLSVRDFFANPSVSLLSEKILALAMETLGESAT